MSRFRMFSAFLLVLMVMAMASLVSPASVAESYATMYLVDFNHSTSFWGIPMDCEWNTSGWHVRAAIAHLVDKELLVPSAIVIDNPVPLVTSLEGWSLEWSRDLLTMVDPYHSHGMKSLYNNMPRRPDFRQARDHLVAAGGIGNDGLPWHDYDNDCKIDNPPTTQIDFYTLPLEVAPTAFTIATKIEQWIEYAFNDANVVNLVASVEQTFFRVFDKTVPDDWHMHFGVGLSVSTTPPPSFLYDLYHHNGARNHVFYSNMAYDYIVEFDPLLPSAAKMAQLVFGATIGTIPVYCVGS